MKILAFPRDPNPYQELLYSEMEKLGARITYVGGVTPSHTLNLLLLPFELAARRVSGARLVHLHWVFAFSLPGARRFPMMRWVAHAGFQAWLRICRLLRLRLVWTAHNVLPHDPVFPDDRSARRDLVAAADLVLVHSESTLEELAALGAAVARSAVIPHGPMRSELSPAVLRQPGSDAGARQFLFFGRVLKYKGVDDLLAAFAEMPRDLPVHLTVAGQCDDHQLRSLLHGLADKVGARVTMRLGYVPEGKIPDLLAAADAVVLPFKRVTSSGSAMLALAHGRPLIVPDLAALADLPDQAVIRYQSGVTGLTGALHNLAVADRQALARMSAAACHYASQTSWGDIARRTLSEMMSVLGNVPSAGKYEESVRAR
jgi:glycosyltransferase involved in cell wall biosynthesis